ncbi:Betaine aldehyde dehydrogenase [Symbiodinium microadriaticum]|uniref:Betaine aldehyde dehydrogenase n=1 Tax=Symbiodinium microadriaticum TaxID=2951 RepID=A0A1Q9EMR1_SYMMI|nr:Betaine aldehyde dehydrogenase [Symbiodinium microadriaticum]
MMGGARVRQEEPSVQKEANSWVFARSFRSEEEAVRLANDTPYGLANAVYSVDAARLARVASQLKSGIVWENCSQVLFPSTPFGGKKGKASGFGFEQGLAGLKEFLAEKTVVGTSRPSYNWQIYKKA